MQKKGYINGNLIQSISVLLLSNLILIYAGCRPGAGETDKGSVNESMSSVTISDVYPVYARFSSFQNPDSTWGYTIFVNSRPYLRVSKMPFKKAGSGFLSKADAEIVADLYVKMINEGDLSPKLDKKTLDSLELILKTRKNRGR
jgi:hypothetical protein